jgi:hypothetical protein
MGVSICAYIGKDVLCIMARKERTRVKHIANKTRIIMTLSNKDVCRGPTGSIFSFVHIWKNL